VDSAPLIDKAQRDLIERQLDATMLVEAAAGTGKTTSMIRRMVALVAEDPSRIRRMAAVTFTRKAAAEIRSRFQLGLEQALRDSGDPVRNPLRTALEHIESCFVGTIHSFCARLLRERPVEAGIDPAFEELDEASDRLLRNQAWDSYSGKLHSTGDPMLTELSSLEIETRQLRSAFFTHCAYPDVDDWPAPAVQPPDFAEIRTLLRNVADYVQKIRPDFPTNYGDWSVLMRKYGRIERMIERRHLDGPDAIDVLRQFTSVKQKDEVDSNRWPEGERRAKEEARMWEDFKKKVDVFLDQWRAHCYPACMKALGQARLVYDELRRQAGVLNYEDLLMKAADLLRDKPHIREYLRKRFTHLLVDEFQDTDPVQAQVMMFLTATDPNERDWEECVPVPGSLFVVGDPKQSIYRFRRADIVTYTKVKRIIENHGTVLTLQTNFRSTKPLIEWVNHTFASKFPSHETPESPVYVPLTARPDSGADDGVPVHRISVPGTISTDEASSWEAPTIAGTIRAAIDGRDRTAANVAEGFGVAPGDFMIITRRKKSLAVYGAEVQKMGIPHQVTGGDTINRMKELRLLGVCLAAVTRPHDPVALVAALRSELFGVSDSALYEYKVTGGEFSYHSAVPASLNATDKAAFVDAFARLRTYAKWFLRMPVMAALERLLSDLGLAAACSALADGNERAGSLLTALELVRSAERDNWSLQRLIAYLDSLRALQEGHDSIPAIPPKERPLRIMNLHKAKGLEAQIVFLADPTGERNVNPDLHIDRSSPCSKGYMLVKTDWGRYQTVIGQPASWGELKEREKAFQKKEEERLLYVAATRAGQSLIVSQRGRRGSWKAFEPQLKTAPLVTDPGPPVCVSPTPTVIGNDEPARAAELVAGRWKNAREPTYATAGAKALALAGATMHGTGSEQGMAWGSAIHAILQVAMSAVEADLKTTAERALDEQDLDLDLIDEALETVRAVMASDIWNRAQQSPYRLVETPFQIELPADPSQERLVPTVLRGVIDLAFLEGEEWVIVDYKTDKRAADHLDDLVAHYGGQVHLYASAWAQITGAKVSERGLFFTHCGRYVTV